MKFIAEGSEGKGEEGGGCGAAAMKRGGKRGKSQRGTFLQMCAYLVILPQTPITIYVWMCVVCIYAQFSKSVLKQHSGTHVTTETVFVGCNHSFHSSH